MEAAYKASFALFEEEAAKNPTFKEIYTGGNKFRQQAFQWSNSNELVYANFVAGK